MTWAGRNRLKDPPRRPSFVLISCEQREKGASLAGEDQGGCLSRAVIGGTSVWGKNTALQPGPIPGLLTASLDTLLQASVY